MEEEHVGVPDFPILGQPMQVQHEEEDEKNQYKEEDEQN